MIANEFNQDATRLLDTQARALLAKQNAIATTSLVRRSGRLISALQSSAELEDCRVTVSYPKYIRFLDMKYGASGKRKKKVPIYNRQVYGYLVGGVRRWLNNVIPGFMIRSIDGTISGEKVK